MSLGRDFGEDLRTNAHVDAQATPGSSQSAGLGKVRHIETAEIWIQVALETQEFELHRVAGEDNPVDVLIEPVSCDVMNRPSISRMSRCARGSSPLIDYGQGDMGTHPATAMASSLSAECGVWTAAEVWAQTSHASQKMEMHM